jgi:2-phospho-L-lactate/phosphoenolpyruvate guanylyltransferase
MKTIAVLPVKRWSAAKRRLDGDLSSGTRRALAEAMVTDVLVALRRATAVDAVLMVTGEEGATALAYGYGADVVDDPADAGHNEAARRGVAEAVARGADRVLLIPGDCPALDPAEVDALLGRPRGGMSEVVVVPDRHGTGTNALVLTPPDVMAPAFGPGSRDRHVAAAQDAGATCAVEEVRSLMFDVDTADDLDALREMLAGASGNAAHTRGMLNRLARR